MTIDPRGTAEKPSTDLRRPCGPSPGSASALLVTPRATTARGPQQVCARSAARRFARIWATWIAESLAEAFPVAPLESELHLLGGRKRVHARAAGGAVVAQRLLDQRVDVDVRVHGIVVEERQLLDACLLGQGQRLLIGGVPESRVGLVLLRAVLRVVHK